MTIGNLFVRMGRGLTVWAAILAFVGLTTVSRPADAGGVSPGAAAGIGLGAFALGSALGAASNPYYYNPYYNPYGYYYPPAPAYYPSTPYYSSRSCWDAYSRRYYAC